MIVFQSCSWLQNAHKMHEVSATSH